MSLFYNRRFKDIASIIALSEEEKMQILNNIQKQISDINMHIQDGYRISDSDWPSYMGNRNVIFQQLEAKREEYRTFAIETNIIMYNSMFGNIDHNAYLRAFNNFMRQMEEDASAAAAREHAAAERDITIVG